MNTKNHGGKRPGAGRKKGNPTCIVSIRIPVSLRDILAEKAQREKTTISKLIRQNCRGLGS